MLRFDGKTVSADVTASQPVTVSAPLTGNGTSAQPIGFSGAVRPTYTVLWQTANPVANVYNISLTDSIDNYDELIVYGSANRDGLFTIKTVNRYDVDKGKINFADCYTHGAWNTDANTHILTNGTNVWLSGNSGTVRSSYFIGQNVGAVSWVGWRGTGRAVDVHPYKIVGVKWSI
jgi:hypothetical protein